MSTAPYKTLRQEAADEVMINKSRFIGYAAPVKTVEEALAFLDRIRTKHKDATHNCYAYIIGPTMGVMRCLRNLPLARSTCTAPSLSRA